jgi:hypothetical protein
LDFSEAHFKTLVAEGDIVKYLLLNLKSKDLKLINATLQTMYQISLLGKLQKVSVTNLTKKMVEIGRKKLYLEGGLDQLILICVRV